MTDLPNVEQVFLSDSWWTWFRHHRARIDALTAWIMRFKVQMNCIIGITHKVDEIVKKWMLEHFPNSNAPLAYL